MEAMVVGLTGRRDWVGLGIWILVVLGGGGGVRMGLLWEFGQMDCVRWRVVCASVWD